MVIAIIFTVGYLLGGMVGIFIMSLMKMSARSSEWDELAFRYQAEQPTLQGQTSE